MTHVALSPQLEASTGLHGVEGFLADTRIAPRTPARTGNILEINFFYVAVGWWGGGGCVQAARIHLNRIRRCNANHLKAIRINKAVGGGGREERRRQGRS